MARTIGYHGGGLRRLWAGTALATLLVGSGGALAVAEPTLSDQEELDAARQILMGATVRSIEIDFSDGAPKGEVEVRTRDGAEYEVMIDMNTATMLSIERDDD